MSEPSDQDIKTNPKTANRRDFLKQSTRVAAFSGLLFFTVFLGKRNRLRSNRFSCKDNSPCLDCGKLSSCKELKAAAFKQINKYGGLKIARQ